MKLPVPLVVLGLLVGCGEPTPRSAASSGVPPADTVAFEMRRLERASPGCETEGPGCTRVALEYPEILGAPGSAEAVEGIARAIRAVTLKTLDEAGDVLAPEALADRFLSDYATFAGEQPDHPMGWSLERRATVAMSTPEVFSVEVAEYSFTGGAHPNSFVTLLSLSPSTGRPLALSDLLVDGFEEPLRALAEARFRAERQLAPDASLGEEGFWFEEDRFELNDNWLVDPDGLRFYFNSYEIAPYVFGPTDLTVGREALRALARPGGVLAAPKVSGTGSG